MAHVPTLPGALTEYYNSCGYLPLSADLGAGELVKRSIASHQSSTVGWDEIWSWAASRGTPLAQYHAVTIALDVPATRPAASSGELWDEVVKILDSTETLDAEDGSGADWILYHELALHFAHHIEALHPGQEGERVACYAWWLAERVGQLLGGSAKRARRVIDQIVRPEATLSFSRWSMARSPVIPSGFRYLTLHTLSAWPLSPVARLHKAAPSVLPQEIQEKICGKIGATTGSYLVMSPLVEDTTLSEAVFGFQEEPWTADIGSDDGLMLLEDREPLAALVEFRRTMANAAEFQCRLERIATLAMPEQQLISLLLRAAVFASTKYDDVISAWLERTLPENNGTDGEPNSS